LHRIAPYDKDSLEHQFLLDVLGSSDQGHPEELHAKAQRVDWTQLFNIAPPDLYGYLGHRLAELGLQSYCPLSLFEETLNARRATTAQWLRLQFELRRLTFEFTRHKVDFLLLKGSVLAFLAYPGSSLRSVSDLDILVRTESLDKALQCVYAAGFRCPERYMNPGNLTEFALPGEQISLPLGKLGTRVLIEIHTQVESAEPWFQVPISRIWENSEEANLNGLLARIPDRHEFLFHLILHLARGHLFSLGLRPLLDVHLWIQLQRGRLDWQWITSECLRRGYNGWAHLTLRLVCDLFGNSNVPSSFFERVPPPPSINRLAHLVLQQIWADRRLDSLVPPRLAITLSQPSLWSAVSTLFMRVKPIGRQGSNATIPALEQSLNRTLSASLRALRNDLSLKVPRYVSAWRSGSLRWSNLMEAARLARGRVEVKRTMDNAQAGLKAFRN
jgi:Uncharacterised nucleotidyltransferase